jgi:hypothetical protein
MNPQARETKAFVCAHLLILGVVLLGFARTFYLHGLFFSKPLPWRLIVHGMVLTLWVVVVVLQGLLALAGQRAWHARLAWLAGALVVGVVATGAWVTVVLDLGLVSAAEPENIFVWIDYFTLLSFPALVAMAVKQRRNRAVHLRLILFASILLSVPALGRLALWPIFHAGLAGAPVFALTGLVLLVLMAVGYDLAAARRVHGASLAGMAGVALPWMLGVAMGASGLGFALLHRA